MTTEKMDSFTQPEQSDMFCLSEEDSIKENALLTTALVSMPLPLSEDAEPQGNTRRSRRRMSVSVRRGSSVLDRSCTGRLFGNTLERGMISRRNSLRIVGNAPEGIDRAVAMVQTYPMMVVEGTAFENQISRNSVIDSIDVAAAQRFSASTSIVEIDESGEVSTSLLDTLSRVRASSCVVSLAVRIKRACMWETIIVNALAQLAWNKMFRLRRLRSALEIHMLPTILRKRGKAGTTGLFVRKAHVRGASLLLDDEGIKAQGSILMEKCRFLASFGSLKLCDALAEVVDRYRFSAGDVIATAGTQKHDALYILMSGKCDAIRHNNIRNLVQRTRVEPGSCFGGVLGSRALFSETYRSISQCILWVIRRDTFEKVFMDHADDDMKRILLDSLRNHEMERLVEDFPLPECMPRVPIYRHIDQPTAQMEVYAKDFKPLVLVKGDVLFKQGDPPGAVYCLVEGCVQRVLPGSDKSGSNSTRQVLSPNDADNNFALSTRFLLLGEEPHILPGAQRYTCTVLSHSVLFFKIEGERFVSALMDDAKLFLELREKLTSQMCQWMRIAPEALRQVPLLRDFSRSQLSTILSMAKARVVQRSVSVCEPAQSIHEIYIVTAGSVRDPREFSRVPTHPVSLPSMEEEMLLEEVNVKGKKGVVLKKNFSSPEKEPKNVPLSTHAEGATKGQVYPPPFAQQAMMNFTPAVHGTFKGLDGVQSIEESFNTLRTITYPDEEFDLSPPLPQNPVRDIVCTLGGGWEGLLVDKWPNGWETTTTVELWAVPVLAIRNAFNSMPKTSQTAVLSYLRNVQMLELGLSAPVVAKLPAMSAYMPFEERLAKPNLNLERETLRVRGRKHVGSSTSGGFSTGTGDRVKTSTNDFSMSRTSTLTMSTPSLSFLGNSSAREEKKAPKRQRLRKKLLPLLSAQRAQPFEKSTNSKKPETVVSVSEVPPPKAGPPPLLFLRRLTPKLVEETPEITPELCAMYIGEKPQENIIRHPFSIERGKKAAHVSDETHVGSNPIWPTASNAKKEWFRVLPSFAPLPGTINNQNYAVVSPSLVPNTALMVRREKGYGDVLAMQAAYFRLQAQKKREAAESSTGLAHVYPTVPFLEKGRVALRGVSHPTPGRHAYRF